MYTYKTIRIDWEVVRVDVDQYEAEQPNTLKVLNTYATRDEARSALPLYAKKKFADQSWDMWVPLNPDHAYQAVFVRRNEVTIEEWKQ
jgi:hypothetical protein